MVAKVVAAYIESHSTNPGSLAYGGKLGIIEDFDDGGQKTVCLAIKSRQRSTKLTD